MAAVAVLFTAVGVLALALRPAPPPDLQVKPSLPPAAAVPPRATLPATLPASLPATLPASSPPPSSASTPIPKMSRRQNPVAAEDTAAKIAAIQTSAEAAAPALRACPDAPQNLSAQLQVHQRRGTVLMVDGETFDDENPWHTCVSRELGHLEFTSTRTPGRWRARRACVPGTAGGGHAPA